MNLKLITAPAVEPLTTAEAKARLNIGTEITDAVMDVLIKAARQSLDGSVGNYGRAFITQTWDLTLDRFDDQCAYPYSRESGFYPYSIYDSARPYDYLRRGVVIPLSPLQAVTYIKYLDSDGVQQTLDPSNYLVQIGEPSKIALSSIGAWPSIEAVQNAITIRFVAGYGPAGSDVPETIRMAIAMQASHLRSLSQQNLFMNREEIPGLYSQGFTVGGGAGQAIDAGAERLMAGLRVLM